MKKVIVVGGGVAGLCAGIYLLKNGFSVSLYEKNKTAGGYLTSWRRKGCLIDGCLHWMLGTKEGTDVARIWKDTGALDHTPLFRPDSFQSVTYDGETFTFYRDIDRFEGELRRLSQGDEAEIDEMMNALRRIGVAEPPARVAYELARREDIGIDLRLIARLKKYYSMTVKGLSERFSSPVIRFAISNSLVNEKFSALYYLQTLSNFFLGNGDLPVGGSLKMQQNLVKSFRTLGGELHLASEVVRLRVENGVATGAVLADGTFVPADYVVCAGDLHHTFSVLLDGRPSGLELFDGDKETYATYSFVLASYRTRHDFGADPISQIFRVEPFRFLGKTYDALSVRHYGYDPALKSGEYTTVQVMLTTYEEDYETIVKFSKAEYAAFKRDFGAFVQGKLKEIYRDSFECIDVLTPLTYERYNHAYKGTFMPYALPPRKGQPLRSAKVEGVENLFLANQWLMMPGGVGCAAVAGKFASQLVCAAEGKAYRY